MKHLRLILLLLAVCFTQISFSQDLAKKLESERILKSIISEILAEADTEQEAENKISSLLEGDADYITEQEKVNVANEYFEKCKKKLAKWDAKLAAGKKVYYEDAMYAANYYVLGFKKICNQDYSKALEYLKLCPQIPVTKMYTVALQYQLNKDKAAALAAMSFINKPSKQLSDVASQYGLEDVYHEKLMSLIADKKQTLKRAIRSKDFETLLSFIPYDIPVVDSLFATSEVDIATASYKESGIWNHRGIEEVEDFNDRNVMFFRNRNQFINSYCICKSYDSIITCMNFQKRLCLFCNCTLIIIIMCLVSRSDFYQCCSTLFHNIRNPEFSTDFNKLTTGYNDFASFCKGT